MSSVLFSTTECVRIQDDVKRLINSSPEVISGNLSEHPRAVGDAMQELVENNLAAILGPLCDEYSANFARRAMADVAFKGTDGIYYVVDVKTHRTDTRFNMPNLTSVERLARFYEDDSNCFCILMINYVVAESTIVVSSVDFVPIEFLSWDCLTIGALGWGQIQIANANRVVVNRKYSRRTWMLEFCDAMLHFYPKEISKIDERLAHFERVRQTWMAKGA